VTSQKPITASVHATPTAALSVAISHSGRGVSGGAIIISLSGVAGALLVLTIALVIVTAVLVCLRRRKNKLNTTENVAYLSTLLASLDTSDMYNCSTSSNEVNDTHISTSTNQAYLEVGKNDSNSDTDMITALSVAVSHSPPHREDGGAGSDEVTINSLSVGMGVAGALLVLTIAPAIVTAVLVCLRRRNNKLNTTENIAYLPTLLPSLDTNEVYNCSTSSNEVTTRLTLK